MPELLVLTEVAVCTIFLCGNEYYTGTVAPDCERSVQLWNCVFLRVEVPNLSTQRGVTNPGCGFPREIWFEWCKALPVVPALWERLQRRRPPMRDMVEW